MDGGAWWATVHGVAKSQIWLSNFTFTFHFHALEKEVATHSSVLAWRITGMGEPDGLPSMGSHRVGHDWSDLATTRAIKRDRPRQGLLSLGKLLYLYGISSSSTVMVPVIRTFKKIWKNKWVIYVWVWGIWLELETDMYVWLLLMNMWGRTTRNPLKQDHSALKDS